MRATTYLEKEVFNYLNHLREKEVFNYLNHLRETGVTNMFGAAPYIEEEFELSRLESRKLLTLWMENFDEDGNYDEIKE